jgi:hypothetical protein
MKKLVLVSIMLSFVSGCFQQVEAEKYEPNWKSLEVAFAMGGAAVV